MSFSHHVDFPALNGIVQALGKQGAFAVVQALTLTAKDIEQADTIGMGDSFDRPAPFTLKAFGVEPATKAKPTARVFMRPIQSKYLQWQIEGGQRSYKGFELRLRDKAVIAYALPGSGISLDKYGNVSRADIVRITAELNAPSAARRYFVGVPKGRPDLPSGVYRRIGKDHISPVLVFAQSAVYTKRFPWLQIAQRTFNARMAINLATALARATATAR